MKNVKDEETIEVRKNHIKQHTTNTAAITQLIAVGKKDDTR